MQRNNSRVISLPCFMTLCQSLAAISLRRHGRPFDIARFWLRLKNRYNQPTSILLSLGHWVRWQASFGLKFNALARIKDFTLMLYLWTWTLIGRQFCWSKTGTGFSRCHEQDRIRDCSLATAKRSGSCLTTYNCIFYPENFTVIWLISCGATSLLFLVLFRE